ncbi:zinc finger BED domain-containing protein RICESLEEPER 2-like isoform X1 [Cornus florida]|uniref:zinc finger BED domain-containing protein RICESLEEPER 2-like isoform X1 n=1 Tax=Cornus florida TaxID=4283 RepID=UPI00289B4179|nr:zinc finger BED domain-containing protein RICESLEEPER 2-like isoform X1 [Cornus florida]XP_059645225.1 zinc finger BED domain-containing protein RICESLEEPER 2-like isoform X1 [Cornus florida]
MIGNFTFDPRLARKDLASMIILHEYPLSIVDHFGLQKFLHSINPVFNMGSRGTMKDDVLKIYDSEKAKCFELLDRLQCRIAITANMWTCGKHKGYLAITAHFIDDAWILNDRMLRFISVPIPHEKEVLADVIMDCLLEWNIAHKVSTITVDSGSTDDEIFDILVDMLSANGSLLLNGKMLQMHCWESVLNSIVKDGLDAIGEGIEKICDSVLFWSATPQRIEIFEDVARQLCVPCSNNLGLLPETRWNSTYSMLQTALHLCSF